MNWEAAQAISERHAALAEELRALFGGRITVRPLHSREVPQSAGYAEGLETAAKCRKLAKAYGAFVHGIAVSLKKVEHIWLPKEPAAREPSWFICNNELITGCDDWWFESCHDHLWLGYSEHAPGESHIAENLAAILEQEPDRDYKCLRT